MLHELRNTIRLSQDGDDSEWEISSPHESVIRVREVRRTSHGWSQWGLGCPQLSQWRLECPTIEPVEVRTSHIWTSGGSDIPYLNLGRFGRPVIQPTGGLRRLTAEPSRGSYYEVRGFKIYTWVRVLGRNWASRAEDQVYLAMYFQLDDFLMICIYCVPTVSNLFFTNESFPTVVEKWPFLVLSFFPLPSRICLCWTDGDQTVWGSCSFMDDGGSWSTMF